MKSSMKVLSVVLLGFALSACETMTSSEDDAAPVDNGGSSASSSSSYSDSASTSGVDPIGTLNGMPIDQDSSPDSVRTVYFEYDSSVVRTEFIPVIAAHGELLASDSSKRVVLEGHADERGSREYNIALGERRALSVRRLLLSSGGRDGQIRVVSYGEERPAVIGHSENAWSKNRRVEIRYE